MIEAWVMVEVSRYADNLAREIASKLRTPVLVIVGEAFRVSVSGGIMRTIEFLGYVGSAANFSVLQSDDGIRICDVRVMMLGLLKTLGLPTVRCRCRGRPRYLAVRSWIREAARQATP